jgi:uncharacterized small protein (DUF1192 family)
MQISKLKIYEGKIVEYENKIAFLNREVDNLTHLVEEWKYKYSALEVQIQSSSQNKRDLENRLVLLSQEVERLNNILK